MRGSLGSGHRGRGYRVWGGAERAPFGTPTRGGRSRRHLSGGSAVAQAVRTHGRQGGCAAGGVCREAGSGSGRAPEPGLCGGRPYRCPLVRATEGLDAAIQRGLDNYKLGADAIFVEAPRTVEEMRRIGEAIDAPLVANMIEGGATPLQPAESLRHSMGFTLVLYPLSVLSGRAPEPGLCGGRPYRCPGHRGAMPLPPRPSPP